MKIDKLCLPVLACLAVLTGCGTADSGESVVSSDAESGAVALTGDEIPVSPEKGTSEEAEPEVAMAETGESGRPLEGEASGAAQAAYGAFLEGDISMFDSEDVSRWGLEDWEDIFLSLGGLEYTCLDLDGDGVEELLVQYADDPGSYNGVFHYADGRLFVWQFDGTEGSCRDYPLQDGTMVRQYDYSGSSTYTLFRYKSNGETEELSTLFLREEVLDPDSDEPCPYYEVDGDEVDKAAFEERLKDLVTDRMLERGDWTGF